MITELVERLRKNSALLEITFSTAENLREAADVIEELSTKLQAANMERSSQYYNGGWIPVSERLPEDRREVLVTAYWHETYQVMMASYYGDGLWWCVPFNNCGEHMQRLNPIAWMPLPPSYQGEENG